MRRKNLRPTVIVAAVAVAAVVLGGVLAAQQGPRSEAGAAAAPLGPPTTTPSATPALPNGKVALKLSKLVKGRDPQMVYRIGREVRGGAGDPVRIPGTGEIHSVARIRDSVLAVVTKEMGTELLRIEYTGKVRHTPDVTSLVVTSDASSAAYAAPHFATTGEEVEGGTIYAEQADRTVQQLKVRGYEISVLAYQNGKVYFRSEKALTGKSWKLYAWTPGSATATLVKTVASPSALSADGTIAASLDAASDTASCTAVVEVSTGKKLWRTCENGIGGFTPDGRTVIAEPTYVDGYGAGAASAVDAKTGKLLYEWSGLSFLQTVPEDDQHFLLRVDDGDGTKAAIIRCDIATGGCELATPLALTQIAIGQ